MGVRRDDLARAAGDQARRRSERLATVEEEIRHARAEALGRTGARLQRILDQLGMLDLCLDALLARGAADTAAAAHLADRIRSETDARNRLFTLLLLGVTALVGGLTIRRLQQITDHRTATASPVRARAGSASGRPRG